MVSDPPTLGFADRREAGRFLGEKLRHYADRPDVQVLALPRGGVPVAYEVARRLRAPLDVFLVRKLGMPGREELALGAVASGGVYVLNEDIIRFANLRSEVVESIKARGLSELERREREFRGRAPFPRIAGRTVIIIDDGLATGATMRAAVKALRSREPARLIVAAPVGSREACREILSEADEAVCGMTPEPFSGVGAWYADFSQTTDNEVRELLADARSWTENTAGSDRRAIPISGAP